MAERFDPSFWPNPGSKILLKPMKPGGNPVPAELVGFTQGRPPAPGKHRKVRVAVAGVVLVLSSEQIGMVTWRAPAREPKTSAGNRQRARRGEVAAKGTAPKLQYPGSPPISSPGGDPWSESNVPFGFVEMDMLEAWDAAHEDENGNVPGQALDGKLFGQAYPGIRAVARHSARRDHED